MLQFGTGSCYFGFVSSFSLSLTRFILFLAPSSIAEYSLGLQTK